MDNKYIELLLKRCLNFEKSNSLLISYNKLNKEFVNEIVIKAREMGIDDIYLEEIDEYYKHDLLAKLSLDEIKNYDYFKATIWDEYAKKDASFLFIESEIPGLMNDIEPEKIALSSYIRRTTKPTYNKKRDNGTLSWCIAAYPNQVWADSIFKNDKDAYFKLKDVIFKMCMIDKENPIDSWNKFLMETDKRVQILNNMHIEKLHYTNSLGTDLYVELPEDSLWCSAFEENRIVNMPSYEVFTTPHYLKTEGIVYASLPLMHNGVLIKDFYIEFKNGKVSNFDAKEGRDVLKGIIESDPNACYLGECALVNNNSPISNTGLIFNTTLFDENASCHLALGAGFGECLINGLSMEEDELLKKGINQSKNHVDFMIGTKDTKIDAYTKEGIVTIFSDGNFII